MDYDSDAAWCDVLAAWVSLALSVSQGNCCCGAEVTDNGGVSLGTAMSKAGQHTGRIHSSRARSAACSLACV